MDTNIASRAILLVGLKGGSVTVTNRDGEAIATEGLTPGRHKCALWVPFMTSEGDTLTFSGDVSPMVPSGGRVRPIPYGPGSHETGANPDFVVTSASRNARELDRKLAMLDQKQDRLEKQLKKAQSISRHTGREIEVAIAEDIAVTEPFDEPLVETANEE